MMKYLEIDGKKLHSIKYAHKHTGYSQDYITRLAREEKIIAAQVRRYWFVDMYSLEHYATTMAIEQKIRQQQLSKERKQEHKLKETVEKNEQERHAYQRTLALQARTTVFAVLLLGLLTGFAIKQAPSLVGPLTHQVASAPFMRWFVPKEQTVEAPLETAPTVTPNGAEVLNFSHEAFRLSTFAEPTEGMLLLPLGGNTKAFNAQSLFSDEVKIITDERGQQYVAALNKNGEVINKIPFVTVSVPPATEFK